MLNVLSLLSLLWLSRLEGKTKLARCEITGNQLTLPHWLAEFSVGSRHMIAPFGVKLDKTAFANYLGVKIQPSSNAAQGATSIAVTALQLPLPSVTLLSATGSLLMLAGSLIVFNNGTDGKFARLTADAHLGDTTLSVQALPTALVTTDVAKWNQFNTVFVPGGIVIGRAVFGTGLFGPGNPAIHQEMGIVMYDTVNLELNNNAEMLKPRAATSIKVNYLYDYASMIADPTTIVDPSVAPTLSMAGTDGTLVAGTYYVGVAFGNTTGETAISPLGAQAITSTGHIGIASYAFPTNATYMKIYASSAPGDPNVQYQKTLFTAGATTLTSVINGANPRTKNNTQSVYGAQLKWLQDNFNCIIGYN